MWQKEATRYNLLRSMLRKVDKHTIKFVAYNVARNAAEGRQIELLRAMSQMADTTKFVGGNITDDR